MELKDIPIGKWYYFYNPNENQDHLSSFFIKDSDGNISVYEDWAYGDGTDLKNVTDRDYEICNNIFKTWKMN